MLLSRKRTITLLHVEVMRPLTLTRLSEARAFSSLTLADKNNIAADYLICIFKPFQSRVLNDVVTRLAIIYDVYTGKPLIMCVCRTSYEFLGAYIFIYKNG